MEIIEEHLQVECHVFARISIIPPRSQDWIRRDKINGYDRSDTLLIKPMRLSDFSLSGIGNRT